MSETSFNRPDSPGLKGDTRPLPYQTVIYLSSGIGIVAVAVLAGAGNYVEATLIACSLIAGAVLLLGQVSVEAVLTFWFVASPLASFFARIPWDKSILTFNRIALALAVVMLLLRRREQADRLKLTKFEIAWASLSVVAIVSAVLKSQDLNAAVRTAVDTFCLPLVAFHLARHHFRTGSLGAALIAGAIALSFFLFAVGFLEFWTAADLFQYKGTLLIRARERRVNGPFNSDSTFAAISLLVALFLIGAPRAFRLKLDASANLARWAAIAAAIAASLLPLFRGIAVAIAACVLTGVLARNRAENRRLRFSVGPKTAAAILVLSSLLIVGGAAGLTDLSALSSRLANPRNLVGRVVTWNVALEFALANPLFGVGLNNYKPYFDANYNQDADWLAREFEVKPADYPHSNYLWIGSELGLPALLAYLLAFAWLIAASWRGLSQQTDHARAAAICSLTLTVAYLVHGLTLTSGWYSDLNLYYFFMTGVAANMFSVEENARQD